MHRNPLRESVFQKLQPSKRMTMVCGVANNQRPGSQGWRYFLAATAGLVWALAFPMAGVAGLGWVAPGLLLLSASGATGRTAFRLGYAAGLVHYLTGLYWLLHMPVAFFPILGWIALAAFLSLYPAGWVWLCWRLLPGSISTDAGVPLRTRIREGIRPMKGSERLAWTLLCGTTWVTWEMIQARLFTGFPWNLLGASQAPQVLLTQTAAFAGVYGLSFLMAWTSASMTLAALVLVAEPEAKSRWQRCLTLPLVVVAGCAVGGWMRFRSPQPATRHIQLALVQPSVPQTMIWDEQASAQRLDRLVRLSREALAAGPDVLVWPEATVPYPIRYDTALQEVVTSLLASNTTHLVLGSDDISWTRDPDGGVTTNYYNSAFLLGPDGRILEHYAKRQLVIFGEYVPLVRWLPFLQWFTPISGGFAAGERRVAFEIGGRNIRFAPLICFEDMFSQVARDQAQGDVDFLLNITNDGWFGESAQQWQHAANASFRAIENGMPLVRCSNNGITCWIDALGRMSDPRFLPSMSVHAEGVKHFTIPLPDRAGSGRTFYRRHGDVFGWSCTAATAAVAWIRLRHRRPRAA